MMSNVCKAVLNGWYVTVESYGGFTREQVLALGQWLSTRFVPYPQAASPTAAPPTGAMSDMWSPSNVPPTPA